MLDLIPRPGFDHQGGVRQAGNVTSACLRDCLDQNDSNPAGQDQAMLAVVAAGRPKCTRGHERITHWIAGQIGMRTRRPGCAA